MEERTRIRLPAHNLEADCFIAGEGPAVVLLHGIGGGSADWERNLDALVDHGFTVYAVDLPGHGGSDPPPRRWDPRNSAALGADILDSLGLASASLIGHSAGGFLAVVTALEHPERVRSVVLVAPAGLERRLGRVLRFLTIPLIGGVLMRPNEIAARAAMAGMFFDPQRAPRSFIDRWIQRAKEPTLRRSFFQLLRSAVGLSGFRRDLVYGPRMQDLSTPSLVIWGVQDDVVPMPSDLAGLTAKNARISVHTFPHCGHWPQVELAETFNATVVDFLLAERSLESGEPS